MSEPFLGQISMFAFPFPPRGWALCDGQTIAVQQNQALFSLLSYTYGGNGSTTFALPDFKGRMPIHQGNGEGLTPRAIGTKDGVESVTLTEQAMPMHVHAFCPVAVDVNGTETSPTGAVFAKSSDNRATFETTVTTPVTMAPIESSPGGSNQAHTNMLPFQAVNYCICINGGIYPTRS